MLVIRAAQMMALEEAHRPQLPSKIARFLRAECPVKAGAIDDRHLLQGINESLEQGASYGLESEWDLCRFCWLAFVHGRYFDEDAQWASDILMSEKWQPAEKIDRLEHYHANYLCRPAKVLAAAVSLEESSATAK